MLHYFHNVKHVPLLLTQKDIARLCLPKPPGAERASFFVEALSGAESELRFNGCSSYFEVEASSRCS